MSREESEPGVGAEDPLQDIDSDDDDSVEEELISSRRVGVAASKETSQRSGNDQMVFIILLVVLIVSVATAFALSVAQYLVINDSQSFAQKVLSASMIIGIIVIFVLYVKNDGITESRLTSARTRSARGQLKYILRHYLSLVGVSFFYPFACILDLLHIVTATSCNAVWRRCGGENYERYISIVLFHLLSILFMGAELLYCIRFHSAQFVRNGSVGCCLMIIMAVNLGLWFMTLLKETAERDVDPYANFSVVVPVQCSQNLTDFDHTLSCVKLDTPLYRRLADVKPYLFPFTIEFSILVGEFLAVKFFSCREPRHPSPSRDTPASNRSNTVCANTSIEVSTGEQPRSARPFRWTFVLVVAIGVLINVVTITLAFYTMSFDGDRGEEIERAVNGRDVFKSYMIFYWVLVSAMIVVGFGCGGWQRVQQKKIRGIDYLMLASAFGTMLDGIVGIIAIFRNSDEIGKRTNWIVFLVSEATNILQIVLQVPFLFFADRVRFSEVERGSLIKGTLKAVVLSMAACNITQWILNSLLLTSTSSIRSNLLRHCFHGGPSTWYFVDGMLGPLAIFFRFSSFLLFMRAYLAG